MIEIADSKRAKRTPAKSKKVSRKKPQTPRSKVRNALRKLWLGSRERAAALKRTDYSCECCGVKQSAAKGKEQKVEVHHNNGIIWDQMIDYVYRHLLCSPDDLTVFCPKCHEAEHDGGAV